MALSVCPTPFSGNTRGAADNADFQGCPRVRQVMDVQVSDILTVTYKTRMSWTYSGIPTPLPSLLVLTLNLRDDTTLLTTLDNMPNIPPRSATLSTERTLVNHPGHLTEKGATTQDDGPGHPYQLTADQVATQYEVDITAGLTNDRAQERLQRYGPNELEGGDGVSWVRVLISQIGASCCPIYEFLQAKDVSSKCYGSRDDSRSHRVARYQVLDRRRCHRW